jgi:hypothetical protein
MTANILALPFMRLWYGSKTIKFFDENFSPLSVNQGYVCCWIGISIHSSGMQRQK